VVFFGDSRAAWWQVPVLPGLQCVATGVPGASASYLARRFEAMIAPLRPAIVVVQMGVNDLTGRLSRASERERAVAEVYAATAAVVGGVRTLGARVILTTIFPLARGSFPDDVTQAAIAAVNRILTGLDAADVTRFDSAAVLAGDDGYVRPAYADDQLHLSAAGYAALNAALTPLLAGEGAT
jgi:lysophospholipase L1-like esterase